MNFGATYLQKSLLAVGLLISSFAHAGLLMRDSEFERFAELVRHPEKLVGFEVIDVMGSKEEIATRFGHALLRLVDDDGIGANDLTLSFHAHNYPYPFDAVKAATGGYEQAMEVQTFEAFAQDYVRGSRRAFHRIPILSTHDLRANFMKVLGGWLHNPKTLGNYAALTRNCVSMLLIAFDEAQFPTAGPYVTFPSDMHDYFAQVMLNPYESLRVNVYDSKQIKESELEALDAALYSLCTYEECAEAYVESAKKQWPDLTLKDLREQLRPKKLRALPRGTIGERGRERDPYLRDKTPEDWRNLKLTLETHYKLVLDRL